jgi:transcriptional regulator with XRE-family HTH domain
MKPQDLKSARARKGWTQKEAAARLAVSQPYLAMLESGERRLRPELARRAVKVFGLPPSLLPPSKSLQAGQWLEDAQTLAEQLGALGYPGFAYLRSRGRKKNPGEVLLKALAQEELEARVVEALPWLLVNYWDLDADWLAEQAKLRDLQNRLGFVVSLAQRVAEKTNPQNEHCRQALAELEAKLERSRLAREDTLCRASLTEGEQRWVMENRSPEARHWNLFTDWRVEALSYV